MQTVNDTYDLCRVPQNPPFEPAKALWRSNTGRIIETPATLQDGQLVHYHSPRSSGRERVFNLIGHVVLYENT